MFIVDIKVWRDVGDCEMGGPMSDDDDDDACFVYSED